MQFQDKMPSRRCRLVATVPLILSALVTLLTLVRGPNCPTLQSSRSWLPQLRLESNPVFLPSAPVTVVADILTKSAHIAEATQEDMGSEQTEQDEASFIAKASLDLRNCATSIRSDFYWSLLSSGIESGSRQRKILVGLTKRSICCRNHYVSLKF
jgi:hypothetical protein